MENRVLTVASLTPFEPIPCTRVEFEQDGKEHSARVVTHVQPVSHSSAVYAHMLDSGDMLLGYLGYFIGAEDPIPQDGGSVIELWRDNSYQCINGRVELIRHPFDNLFNHLVPGREGWLIRTGQRYTAATTFEIVGDAPVTMEDLAALDLDELMFHQLFVTPDNMHYDKSTVESLWQEHRLWAEGEVYSAYVVRLVALPGGSTPYMFEKDLVDVSHEIVGLELAEKELDRIFQEVLEDMA